MSTHSVIGVMDGGKYKTVYCHFDGSLRANGQVLYTYYDSAKANNLVALGSLSSLDSEIETCIFYGRDRGEADQNYDVFENDDDLFNFYDELYYYIMKDGEWVFSDGVHSWIPLGDALKTAENLEDFDE